MRNKYFILLSAGAILVIVIVLAFVLILSGRSNSTSPDDGDVFGDTSGERPFDIDTGSEQNGASGSSSALVLHGESLPVLRKLTEEPVVAATTIRVRDDVGTEPYARYTEKATGHIFDVNLARTTPPKQMSIVTIPRIQAAYWGQNASTSAVQYFNQDVRTLYTFMGSLLEAEETENTTEEGPEFYLDGAFLAENIISLSFSPTRDAVFYLVRTEEGSVGYVESIDSGSRTQVWQSPIREVVATWNAPEYILVSTKPGSDSLGWVWRVNAQTGARSLMLSEIIGVTTRANTTGEKVLFSTLETTLASLRVLSVETGKITHLPLVTLPEKCVWSALDPDVLYCGVPTAIPRKREFPEGWYQGTVTWQDNIWRIDTETNTTKLLATVNELVDRPVDAVDLTLSPDEDFLVFRAREDDSLWSFKLPVVAPPETQATGTSATTF